LLKTKVPQKYFTFYQPLTNHKRSSLVGCTKQTASASGNWGFN